MPQLRKAEVKRVFLPTFEDESEENKAWVDVQTPVQMSDFDDVDQADSQIMQSASVLAKKIKAWNLNDEAGNVLPISAMNIASLDAIDFASLTMALGLNKLTKLTAQKKIS